MIMAKITRKALNFDLDTKALERFYPGESYQQAYYDIRQYLENTGFQHRQGSGYVSKDPISVYKVSLLINDMSEKFPWLSRCTKVVDATSIGKTFSMMSYLSAVKEEQKFENQKADKDNVIEEYEMEM